MDLEEWEILSDEGNIDYHDDQGVTKNNISPKFKLKNNTVINMDYFKEIPQIIDDHEIKDQNFGVLGHKSDDQEMISKDFFNKLKENEFVDMKIDSPKSLNRGILPQIDQKHEKDENFEENKVKEDEKMVVCEEKKVKMEEKMSWKNGENGGVNIWKWAMNGMGAVVSFGFVAATVSLIVFSNQHKQTKHSKNQELHFQFYSNDKRFKQVVRRAKRLNEAISVMRGAPLTTAHITVGGYYET
ncbi:hypothetical protein RND81_14G058600 [Saponaria officinalis]|uniref:DUF6821 domain-containing protein n=1 Tax=Saponaria officinalis TaxID=3572 RepID=A0AAW1GI84_SAPOF